MYLIRGKNYTAQERVPKYTSYVYIVCTYVLKKGEYTTQGHIPKIYKYMYIVHVFD